jgi:hypothetical protein
MSHRWNHIMQYGYTINKDSNKPLVVLEPLRRIHIMRESVSLYIDTTFRFKLVRDRC